MESKDKLVEFEKYCSQCKFSSAKEEEEPCCDCLEYPVNANSHKPVCFEKK